MGGWQVHQQSEPVLCSLTGYYGLLLDCIDSQNYKALLASDLLHHQMYAIALVLKQMHCCSEGILIRHENWWFSLVAAGAQQSSARQFCQQSDGLLHINMLDPSTVAAQAFR